MNWLSSNKCLLNAFSVPSSNYPLGWLHAGVVWVNTMEKPTCLQRLSGSWGGEIVKWDFPCELSVSFPSCLNRPLKVSPGSQNLWNSGGNTNVLIIPHCLGMCLSLYVKLVWLPDDQIFITEGRSWSGVTAFFVISVQVGFQTRQCQEVWEENGVRC